MIQDSRPDPIVILAALSQLARSGGKIPETLTGKLAVRVALGFDTLAALHQQLGQVVAGLKAQGAAKPGNLPL